MSQHPKPGWRWRLPAAYALAIVVFAVISATLVGFTSAPDWVSLVLSGAFAGLLAGPLMRRWRMLADRELQARPRNASEEHSVGGE